MSADKAGSHRATEPGRSSAARNGMPKKMEEKKEISSKLKRIQEGREAEVSIGAVRVVAAPEDRPPFPVEAMVFEEDTYLVLSPGWEKIESEDLPLGILVEALEADPHDPGNVVVCGDLPLRFLAVVHDLDREPSWREDWVSLALEGVFREAERRGLQRIALPFLGTKHGSLEKARFVVLLREFLEGHPPPHSFEVWLVLQKTPGFPFSYGPEGV